MTSNPTALDTEGYRFPDDTLRAYTSVGCYPIFYVTHDGSCLCAKCATSDGQTNDPDDPQWFLTGADIHWEGDPLICEHCNESIEPAYPADEKAASDGEA